MELPENVTIRMAPRNDPPDRVGQKVTLKTEYQGHTEGTIVDNIGYNAWGVPLYGVHFPGYTYGGRFITVDFAANEFLDDKAAEYQAMSDRGLQWIQDVLDS